VGVATERGDQVEEIKMNDVMGCAEASRRKSVEIADAEYRFAGLHDLIAQNRLPKG
jgi:hypothetical protein